jgi:hypothetical protein
LYADIVVQYIYWISHSTTRYSPISVKDQLIDQLRPRITWSPLEIKICLYLWHWLRDVPVRHHQKGAEAFYRRSCLS